MSQAINNFMSTPNQLLHPEHRINLRLLIWLRVFAITGQFSAVYLAKNLLDISLQTNILYAWIAVYAFINLLTLLRLSIKHEIYRWEFFAHLLVDIFILTILLRFSEGGANPFVSLYLIPLTISAITLPAVFTWLLAAITVGCYSLLMWVINPMNEHSFHAHNFDIHVTGMWLGFVISAVLVSFFVVRMGRTIQIQQKELTKQKTQALQNEQLVRLGTLAASTAHELGTPLGTMQLIVEEIQDDEAKQATKDQLAILKDQINRCKGALSILSASVGTAPLQSGEPMDIQNFINELLVDWQQSRPNINIQTSWKGEAPGPKIIAERSLKQAIKNILDNAANASPEYVSCETILESRNLTIRVSDHGPGIEFDAHETIGKEPLTDKAKGLGLGLFLSHGIIERFGGKVSLKNVAEGGLQTTILLPIHKLAVA